MAISPQTLLIEVKNTAAWLFTPGFTEHSYVPALLTQDHYFRMTLAAHYATCCTLVPTNVDNYIREHHWADITTQQGLDASLLVADEAAAWPVHEVSDRWVEAGGEIISGHDGEWLAVRAGAWKRGLELGLDVAKPLEQIHASVQRQGRVLRTLAHTRGRELDTLRGVALVAHNLGDLQRIMETPDYGEFTSLFQQALVAYKEIMADENNRFLPLREARSLRTSRKLIIPMGPFFDAWGETVARTLDDAGRAEVLSALLTAHNDTPQQQGYLRAIAGMNQIKGGVARLERDIAARLRKVLASPAVKQALDLDARRFEARIINRYQKCRLH